MTQENNKPVINKGLSGIYADETKIAELLPEQNMLTYRGYPAQELAEKCTFEEVAYLLWNGELASPAEMIEFEINERRQRNIDPSLLRMIFDQVEKNAHPMDILRTAVSFIGAQDRNWKDSSPEASKMKALSLMAKIPTVLAASMRMKMGLDVVEPRENLSFSENFFHMAFGEVPEPEVVKAFDATMVLYAEHGFNASTFAARTVASTNSDIYSAVTAGIGALKGPIHGGANEAVMTMLEDVGIPEHAEEWVKDRLAKKDKIMGFGHAVYKSGDARVPYLKKLFNDVAILRNGERLLETAREVERVMKQEKNLWPNVDFPAGPLYHLMGFEKEMFTPFFVMARVAGWTAHYMEQRENNALIRPLSHYSGPPKRPVP